MHTAPNYIDLIKGLHDGDENAIKDLYSLYYQSLCYFAENLTGNKAEAEDIAVESFLKLLKKKEDFTSLRAIKTFLFTVARNACIDFLRKEKRQPLVPLNMDAIPDEDELTADAEMITARVLQIIYAEIENLPDQCRRVFKSYFIEGKSSAVIAEEMGISPQTVLNQKTKALQKLRLTLFKEGLYSTAILMYVLSLLELK